MFIEKFVALDDPNDASVIIENADDIPESISSDPEDDADELIVISTTLAS